MSEDQNRPVRDKLFHGESKEEKKRRLHDEACRLEKIREKGEAR